MPFDASVTFIRTMGRCFSQLRLGLGALALALALTAAGCGDDDESPITTVTTGPTGLTGATGASGSQEDFIDEADAICAESNAAIANLSSTSGAEGSINQELTITEGEVDGLKSLGDPPEERRYL